MDEMNIENKKSLNIEKIVDRILVCVLIIFCIVLTIMGIDIEKKLKKLNETIPVTESVQLTEYVTTDLNSVTSNTSAPSSYAATAISTIESTNVTIEQPSQPITSLQETSATTTVTTAETTTATTTLTTTETEVFSYTSPPTQITTNSVITDVQTTVQPTSAYIFTTHKDNQNDGKYYVTASGKKYHIGSCSYLSKTKIEISLDEALNKGYEPCSRCIK